MKKKFEEETRKIDSFARRLREEVWRPGFLHDLRGRFAVMWTLATRIPLPRAWWPRETVAGSDALTLLPLVGGAFGLLSALPAFLIGLLIPQAAAAWIACGIYVVLGWSFHLDGWGDLWDGIGSGKSGEEMRAVMKDSRTGSFAVAGIVLAIATRASLLSSIALDEWLPVCIAAGGAGRFAACVAACIGEYPWPSGLAQSYVGTFKGYQLFCSFIAACFMFPFAPAGWLFGMVAASLAGAGFALWANKRLGGTNGDVLGAAAVLGEILVLIGCVL